MPCNRITNRTISRAGFPLNGLKDGDAAYIADAVTEIFFDEEQFDDALDFFFSTLREPLEVGLSACARAHGKEIDDLSDDEIADVVGKLTDLYMEKLVHALMVAQKAPEIYTVLHSGKEKLTAHGDFNRSVRENHDKINFGKRWMHSDTKLGEALSLEQVAKNAPEAVAAGTDFFSSLDSNEDAYIELRNGFLATLSEADRLLFTLREEGKTQKEIADQLGYKTHGAVSKRLQTMRGQFEEYLKSQQKLHFTQPLGFIAGWFFCRPPIFYKIFSTVRNIFRFSPCGNNGGRAKQKKKTATAILSGCFQWSLSRIR